MKRRIRLFSSILALLLALSMMVTGLSGCDALNDLLNDVDLPILEDINNALDNAMHGSDKEIAEDNNIPSFESLNDIPPFSGSPYVILNDNNPDFNVEELTTRSFESYSDLDSLGRCGVALACVGQDLMPTEERGSISSVKPTGWQSVKYDIVDGKYLYNRCHLIGFQLTGENANKYNLITGTRYMNVEGMLPFENMIADYVKETGNHVLYRVTPVFDGNNLVASGAILEAYSVEDQGDGICFNVYVYNAQPGITINYATGESVLGDKLPEEEVKPVEPTDPDTPVSNAPDAPDAPDAPEENTEAIEGLYILNTGTKKFHYSNCSSATSMSSANKQEYRGDRDTLIAQGYTACGKCNP